MSLERVVRDHGIRRVIHLAAWHVPLCRRDPPRGASINVTGTEAAASTFRELT
jgi:FlaA1/EpsC-like NDP-sugar epimerase